MKATDCLAAEHQVLLRQMEHLQQALESAASSPEALGAAARLFAAGLEGHAALEEEFLYPALEPHLGRDFGPLAVMDAEHQDIRATLGQALEAGHDAQLRALLGHLLEVLYGHFSKEEHILFPMAEEHLGPQELEALGGRCAACNRPPAF